MIRIGVVIPARDEEALIARCLDSVVASRLATGIDASIIVVADACRDATIAIAERVEGVVVRRAEVANVGIARASGAQLAVTHGCTWLAFTDADSVVPPNWLANHARAAADGHDALIGTVRPDFRELSGAQIEHWLATHSRGRPNGHVHGANLGISVRAYAAAGGFAPLVEHEDVDLIERLRAVGADLYASDEAEVMTSARLIGRTTGGYARHLREIKAMLEPGAQGLDSAALTG